MKRRYHLHLPGLFYVVLTIFVGFAAAFSRYNNLLVWVFGIMLASVLLSGITSGFMLLRLRVSRLDPGHGSVGEPLVITYAVTNLARWLPVFDLHIEELPAPGEGGWSSALQGGDAWVLHAGGSETVHGEAVFWPQRRGRPEFRRFRVWTTFPFGILKKSITIDQVQHTLIYPRQFKLRADLVASLAPVGLSGVRLSRQVGEGDEFFGTREYRLGDSIRQIAWKRSAGLDTLISIERTRPSPPRLRVVLNLTSPTAKLRVDPGGKDPAELEETAISLAASVLVQAAELGYEAGLTILGLDHSPTPLRRSHWHTQKMLGALAAIDLTGERKPARLAGDAERTALVVIHPDRIDPALARSEAVHLAATQIDRFVQREAPAPAPRQEAAA
jgi:uncharacterized protein (DUF58 family)